MPLTLTGKQAIVDEVVEVVRGAVTIVVADYRGLAVSDMTLLRCDARKADVSLRVVRNTLSRRALKDTPFDCLNDALIGPVFLAVSKDTDTPGSPAKLLRDFSKKHEQLKVKAIAIDGKLLDVGNLESVANLPTRDEALAKLLFMLKAPIAKLARTLNEPAAKVTRAIAAVRDKKKET